MSVVLDRKVALTLGNCILGCTIMNPQSYFVCNVSFSSLKGDPLEGTNHTEFRAQKGEVAIVINSCTMVSLSQQRITFAHCATWAVVHYEINLR